MLLNIKPEKVKRKIAPLTDFEKSMIKGLIKYGFSNQDVAFIINQGRKQTINSGRISETESDENIIATTKEEVEYFIKVQGAYDSKTLLNPYKDKRLIKSREMMLSAVQCYNNPLTCFKLESFCIFSIIAWTNLIHEKYDRDYNKIPTRQNGYIASLNDLINNDEFPIKHKAVIENLKKIIELRNIVEHQDFYDDFDKFGELFQSCCLNYDHYLTEWFGEHLSLSKHLSLALQFVGLDKGQIKALDYSNWPPLIKTIYQEIENNQFKNDNAFVFRVYYGTEVSSRNNCEITKLIDYDENKATEIVSIKKVDNLSEYPLTYKELFKKLKYIIPNMKKQELDKIIKDLKIKQNTKYAKIVFRNNELKNKYDKDKIIKKELPIVYKDETVNYILEIYRNKIQTEKK